MDDGEGKKVDIDVDSYDLLLKYVTEFIASTTPIRPNN